MTGYIIKSLYYCTSIKIGFIFHWLREKIMNTNYTILFLTSLMGVPSREKLGAETD